IEIENGRDLQIREGLTLDGTITINRDSSSTATRLLMATSGVIDGDATIALNDTSTSGVGRAQFIDLVGGLTTTLADTVLVRGSGQISSSLVNNGIIRADANGRALRLIVSAKTTHNVLEAIDSGLLQLETTINQ